VLEWLLLERLPRTTEKHLVAVEKVGSDFVPLVVETFGVWTQYALKTLYEQFKNDPAILGSTRLRG